MTPQEAIAKLEGKTIHRDSFKDKLDEGKISDYIKKPQLEEVEIPKDIDTTSPGKTYDFIWIFATVLIMGGLVLFYLWRFDAVSKNSYNNGFNDGVASISPDLAWVQKENSDKLQQIHQLQQGIESMNQQKDQLANTLKKAQESLPRIEQQLEEKIKALTEDSKKMISNFKDRLSFAQNNINDKSRQLEILQKKLSDKDQQLGKLQQDLTKSRHGTDLLRQDLTKIRKELELVQDKRKGKP